MHYRVQYEIDVEGQTPRQAAEAAWEIMKDPASFPPILTVIDHKYGNKVNVDLNEANDEHT